MSKLEKILLALAITLTITSVALTIYKNTSVVSGSVSYANEYIATTTDSNWNSSTCKLLQTGVGSVGSVVVTLGSNAPLEIYDATTTGPHSDHATTSIALFKTTATAGTYTLDSRFTRGLCVVGASTVGVASTTITFR